MAKFRYDAKKGEFATAMLAAKDPIAAAGKAAIIEAAGIIKADGRSAIASAGFSKKWQNALRANTYPKGNSIDAAALIYHKIPYAGVFEEGAAIAGKPLMWLPLTNSPIGKMSRRMRPKDYFKRVGQPLYSMNLPGKPPMLGAKVRMTDKRVGKAISMSLLRRGRNPGGKGTVRLVPLFVGVPQVKLRSRFSIKLIAERTANRLGELYLKNLKVE